MGAEERDVVVIGAGVAGLTAATRLAAAGVDVAVIEARDRVGGRVLTEDVGGLELELGGQWIAPYQHAVRAVIADLGLDLFSRYREGEDVEVGADKAPVRVRHDAHDPAYEEAVEALEAVTRELDPDAPWEHPRAAELDAVPYAAWLREAIRDESAREALGFVATGFMTKPSQSFSLLQAAWLLSSAGEVRNLLDADLVLDARVVGGAQRIALGLAEGLGDRVRLGAPVRDVAWTEGGVDVHVPGGEISAARLIVAIPPNLTGTIRFDPPLPAWRMRAEQETSQGSLIKVQAAYDEPFWRADGLSGTGLGPGEPVSEIYDNSPPGGSPGVVVGFLAAGAAEAATRLREPERRRLVLGSLARYLGPRALQPTHYSERDWNRDEWTRGAYSPTFGVGGLSRFGADLRRPIGPIAFAGSDIAGVGTMHMDGAVRSGQAAADLVLAGR
ncbi:MAG: FAD-dependent oxidoreductase [Solirubrobacteraceae bacterium]